MAPMRKALGVSVSPHAADEFERIAEEEGYTTSDLFCRMFRLYQSYRTPMTHHRGQSSDAWVKRLIVEARDAERRSPMSAKEFDAEIARAGRYGAKRLEAIGITSEMDLSEVLYEQRRSISR